MNNENNKFLTVSWLSGLLSAEIFISTCEWGVQMPPLTSENSHFLRSEPQEANMVMWNMLWVNILDKLYDEYHSSLNMCIIDQKVTLTFFNPWSHFLPKPSFGFCALSSPMSVYVCVYQSLACPQDSWSPVQARITKFGPEKQKQFGPNLLF